MVVIKIKVKIPNWLDLLFTYPLLTYRLLHYGYSFRKIYLSEGEYAIVDQEDYCRFGAFKWCATGDDECVYAARIIKKTVAGRVKAVYLHREIMRPPRGLLVDHRNNNTLDNRRANLRLATHSQNACNSNSRIDKSKTVSRFRGLVFLKRKKKWGARIGYQGKVMWLGSFNNEIDAARAYDNAAKQYHGEFAKLNFSEEIERSPKRLNLRLANWLGARLNFSERSLPAVCLAGGDPRSKAQIPECRYPGPRQGTHNVEIRNTNDKRRTGLLMNRTFRVISCCILLAIFAFAGCVARKRTVDSRSEDMAATKMSLKDARAKRVWEIFRQVSAIPRCSKNEQQIIEWLKDFAKNHNLVCRSDAVGNTVIELPPTKGYENAPAVILQSHVDMVCEKTPESKHDFSKDPIELIERDGWVCANGTTLGADDGLGVALALALPALESCRRGAEEKLPHPKLELLFTVDEETGLTGANALQQGFITGKYLINLDGEDKSLIVGCAGGENTEITLNIEWADAPTGLDCFAIKISGLYGGHSGVDIDKKRANAIKLLARTLRELQGHFDFSICSIDAGKASNAIPRDAQAILCFDTSALPAIKQQLAELESSFKKEFPATEPNLKVEIAQSADCCKQVLSPQCAEKVVNLLSDLPTGVYRMSDEFKGTVETSNNLASVKTIRNENLIRITTMQRGFEQSSMDDLTGKIVTIARQAGAKVKVSEKYPAWKPFGLAPPTTTFEGRQGGPDTSSSLLKWAKEIHRKLNKKEPQVRVVHAGLEPAVIGEKFPDIEMISVGPTIQNPHSPQERLNIASVDKAWEFLLELLPALSGRV
jgi:dipeptidase D